MKIAVPLKQNEQIDDHFGHCEFYGVYTISEDKKVVNRKIFPSTQGCGCKSNIAGVLSRDGVKVMLAGGIGEGAIRVLNNAGIEVVRGCSGNAAEAVNFFLNGSLMDSGESCQHHDGHHH